MEAGWVAEKVSVSAAVLGFMLPPACRDITPPRSDSVRRTGKEKVRAFE